MLLDSVRLVRISAARYFNMKGSPSFNDADFDKAQKEYLEQLDMNADFPSGQYQIACKKGPFIANAFYNYALKLQENGLDKKANMIIDKALETEPYNERLLYAKLVNQLNNNQNEVALSICLKLLEISPNNANYQQILGRLKQKKSE